MLHAGSAVLTDYALSNSEGKPVCHMSKLEAKPFKQGASTLPARITGAYAPGQHTPSQVECLYALEWCSHSHSASLAHHASFSTLQSPALQPSLGGIHLWNVQKDAARMTAAAIATAQAVSSTGIPNDISLTTYGGQNRTKDLLGSTSISKRCNGSNQAGLWGLLRTVAQEHKAAIITALDQTPLQPHSYTSPVNAAQALQGSMYGSAQRAGNASQ